MSAIIKVHGLCFAVDSQGFVGAAAEADGNRGEEHAETILLEQYGPDALAKIHADALAGQADDNEAGPNTEQQAAIDELDQVAESAHKVATAGWYRPEAAGISVTAWHAP